MYKGLVASSYICSFSPHKFSNLSLAGDFYLVAGYNTNCSELYNFFVFFFDIYFLLYMFI
jgi:hypothetical protein